MSDLKQRSYLYRPHGGKVIRIAQIKSAKFPQIRKVSGDIYVPNLGKVPVLRDTGRVNHNEVSVSIGGSYITMKLDPKDVRQCLRLLRKEEAERLRDIDMKIRMLEADREELIRQAWAKGHVVYLRDLEEMAREGEG